MQRFDSLEIVANAIVFEDFTLFLNNQLTFHPPKYHWITTILTSNQLRYSSNKVNWNEERVSFFDVSERDQQKYKEYKGLRMWII